jgi:tetratricopeptide (TPR) repeat protein
MPATLPVALEPTVEGKLRQAEAAMSKGRYGEAVSPAFSGLRQALVESRKGDPRATALYDQMQRLCFKLAEQALQAKQYDVAGHCYSQLRNMYPPSVTTEPLLGAADVARLRGGGFWEAYELYGEYLKQPNRPRDHRGELGMGLTCLALGQHSQAAYYLRNAIRLAPNLAEAHMGLARAYHGAKQFSKAAEAARKAVQLDDGEPPEKRHREYRYWLALVLKDAGQFDEAIATARQLTDSIRASIKAQPGDPELIDQLDKALTLRFQFLDSQSRTDQGSKDPRVFLEMAQVIEEQGAIQQVRAYFHAIELVLGALSLQPEDVNAGLRLGGLYRQVGNAAEAIKVYQGVLKVSPDNQEAKETLRAMGAPLAAPEPTVTSGPTTLPSPATAPAPPIAPSPATAPGPMSTPEPTTAPATTSKPQ